MKSVLCKRGGRDNDVTDVSSCTEIFEHLRIVGEIYDPDEEKDQVERQQNKAKIKQRLSTISSGSSECWLRVRCVS